jgi:hypothetical protein
MSLCPGAGVLGETKSVWVAAMERGEESGEDGAGRMEVELAGRTLAYTDDGDCGRVAVVAVVSVGLGVKEYGWLSRSMGEEAAVEVSRLGWAVTKTRPVELVEVVVVESVLGSEDSVAVLFLEQYRWHSAFHVPRKSERCDHRVMVVVVSGWILQGHIMNGGHPKHDNVRDMGESIRLIGAGHDSNTREKRPCGMAWEDLSMKTVS